MGSMVSLRSYDGVRMVDDRWGREGMRCLLAVVRDT
jgi:hypothetical protein